MENTALERIGFRVQASRFNTMAAAHRHLDIEINYLFRGRIRYFFNGRDIALHAGTVALFWAGMPHQMRGQESSAEGLFITLPLNWILGWSEAAPLRDSLFAGHFITEPSPESAYARSDEERFQRWLQDFAEGNSSRHDLIILELKARLARLALARGEKNARSARSQTTGATVIERVTAYLGGHFQEKLTAETIAAQVGLNQNYLHQLFHKQCGMTLGNYLLNLRLAHAQRLLLETDAKILDVALQSGFFSASNFYHHFKRRTGLDPRAFRQNGQSHVSI